MAHGSGTERRAAGDPVKALVIGGTGLIGRAVVRALLARGAAVTCYGRRAGAAVPGGATYLSGDRRVPGALDTVLGGARFDLVVDLACFTEAEAEDAVRSFRGRCAHFVFCSTVCTYGVDVPPGVLVDELAPQTPPTPYGRGKLACERAFWRAMDDRAFAVTVIRPSHTYGPGAPLLDQLEIDGVAWDRVAHGLPVLCAGDGLGLWQSTHHDDCARLFAAVALEPAAYGQAYNATPGGVFTWRDYHRRVAAVLGAKARLVFAPAAWLVDAAPGRFGFLAETSRHHGAYASTKARHQFPTFAETVTLEDGARATLEDVRRRGAWRDGRGDGVYQAVVERALALGFGVVEA